MIRPCLALALLMTAVRAAGPYPPAAGKAGSDAISKDDPAFVNWASGYSNITYGTDVDATWKTPAKALGKATTDAFDIVSLGNKGTMTLWFPNPIADGPGADFAVFENSFDDSFLELAYVEVSSDGVNFFRFPSVSLTAAKVGGFGSVDPTNLSGLAGKYRGGYGTPFDLAGLAGSPLLDKGNVCFVRIVDIKGDGSEQDSAGRVIYDPYPTIGSAGFDLDAIGVIHQSEDFRILRMEKSEQGILLEWQSNPANRYRVETSPDLAVWTSLETIPGSLTTGTLSKIEPADAAGRQFWRIVRLSE
jgi:hypothetical protein